MNVLKFGLYKSVMLLSVCAFATQSFASKKGNPYDLPEFKFSGVANVVAGSSPDNSYEILIDAINGAKKNIFIEAYMLRSNSIAAALHQAQMRGVYVQALIDGWTVGRAKAQKIDELELYHAAKIVSLGGKVTYLNSNTRFRDDRRFRYLHSKFAVIDKKSVFISSENLANSGFSPNKTVGNRGWVILVENPEIAKAYLQIIADDLQPLSQYNDLADYGSLPEFTLKDPNMDITHTPSTGTYIPSPKKVVTGMVNVERVTSPDNSGYALVNAINNAKETLEIEQLSFSPHWGTKSDTAETHPSPLIDSVLNAARRGVKVRVLVSPLYFPNKPKPQPSPTSTNSLIDNIFVATSWSSVVADQDGQADDGGKQNPPEPGQEFPDSLNNKALVAFLRGAAKAENLPLEASFLYVTDQKLYALHNKGMIVDGDTTLVSSINWVENSVKNNREVGMLIQSRAVADYYSHIFELDWKYFKNRN